VLDTLADQGFKLTPSGVLVPVPEDKEALRMLHLKAVQAQQARARGALETRERAFLKRIASGHEVEPRAIRPRLVVLDVGRSENALLWRWCSLHWSIPVSGGYGRRIRALVVDDAHNGAVMGVMGLADPVYALRARDEHIGWTPDIKREMLANVMDAFVLGAVPPYSHLLGGKLMAGLLLSEELQTVFHQRYGHTVTRISNRDPDAKLALITTTSALGRSSVYNRVRTRSGDLVMKSVGFTNGSGDFHFSGDIYDELAALAVESAGPGVTHRNAKWGQGFRNRREVVQRALRALGLNPDRLRVHGVRREVFLASTAKNTMPWLRGEDQSLEFRTQTTADVAQWWIERWAVPRAQRLSDEHSWRNFDRESWALYS